MDDLFATLLSEARRGREKAYAPYSHFSVGAALVTSSGRIFAAGNVENASYGLTICAERNAIGQMVMAGEKEIAAILILGGGPALLPPCGACRQVIAEFAMPQTRVFMCAGDGRAEEMTFSDLFPKAFSLK